jgi:DNA alkylation damage repair protein AlkB
MTVFDGETELRSNEQKLRRCTSERKAKEAVPGLITDPSSLELICLPSARKPVYKFLELDDSVYYMPSFLDGSGILRLSNEILNDMIDNPPHANNFGCVKMKGMWRDFCDDTLSDKTLNKLRWSCVGYHYNWSERKYDPLEKSSFPNSFKDLFNQAIFEVNKTLESGPLVGDPQSAIINFYHSHRVSDRLGGHRDDVESTDSTPLVCVSMGLPAVFLIDSKAIVVRSGDVLIMSGRARQSLHGVPCIFHDDRTRKRPTAGEANDSLCSLDIVEEFLTRTRISISIRQVY